MSATARVTFLMEPKQKAALAKKAKAEGLSLGEFIRNRAMDEDEVLKALASELRASTANALQSMDALIARMDKNEQNFMQREAEIRTTAKNELKGFDFDALAQALQEGNYPQMGHSAR